MLVVGNGRLGVDVPGGKPFLEGSDGMESRPSGACWKQRLFLKHPLDPPLPGVSEKSLQDQTQDKVLCKDSAVATCQVPPVLPDQELLSLESRSITSEATHSSSEELWVQWG